MAGKSKINFAEVGKRMGGIAAGVVGAGVIKRYLTNSVGMKEDTVDAALIGVGVFAPSLAGGSPLVGHAGNAIITKAVDSLLRRKMGNVVSGVEDSVSGYDDDSVSGYPTSDEMIVSGTLTDESVAGVGSTL